jgi:hypothetical protein
MLSQAADLAARLAQQAEAVCRHYLSAGRREGRYWRVGNVANAPGASLYVRLSPPNAGKWTDAATGEHGDLLDLITAREGLPTLTAGMGEARRFLSLPRTEPMRTAPPAAAPSLAAQRLFAAGRPLKGTPADRYLRSRGIHLQTQQRWLRYHPHCFYRGSDGDQAWPALLAGVTDLAGELRGVHRTWLTRAGTKAPVADPRKAMGELLGHAVQFGHALDVLAAGEGLESVLSIREVLPRLPAAAALSAAHLSALLLPATLQRLYLVLDDDRAGQRAADRLSVRSAGVELIRLLPRAGDFNEDLQRLGRQALARCLRRQMPAEDWRRFSG